MASLLADPENTLAIAQVIVAIFTMIYSYDVLIMHKRYKSFGEAISKRSSILTLGIFITVTAFAIEAFGKWTFQMDILKIIGIFIIGFFFRKIMHDFFTKKAVHVHR